MTPTAIPLTLTLVRQGPTVSVELAHSDPDSQAVVAPLRAELPLDLDALRKLQLQPQEYGRALAAQVFASPALKGRFLQVEASAGSHGRPLRLSIRVDPSAQDLQALRWELLCHPVTHELLAISERIWFSRFMVSTDWRPVHLRAKGDLRAVVAVAAPPPEDLARFKLAPVDLDGELGRAKAALAGLPLHTLGGAGQPCTLDALVAAARGADLLVLTCHGSFSRSAEGSHGAGSPRLFLQDDDGRLKVERGEDLARRLGALDRGPRLVVLASCQSAGDGQQAEAPSSVTATLAAQLADAGVPAVIAMQGQVSMATAEKLMPELYRELLTDGQIDRALAVARSAVQRRPDAWMPVLFLRLTSGRIWYTPGFGGRDAETWRRLVRPVQQGKVVPLIGPGLLEHICGTSFTAARNLAEKVGFPLAPYEWDDLPRVTQFLAVKESRKNVVWAWQDQLAENAVALHRDWLGPEGAKAAKLGPLLGQISRHVRAEDALEPYKLLAGLPAPVYLTTNPDPALLSALVEEGREPQRVLTRWRYGKKPEPRGEPLPEPTREAPLVFHALGAFGKDSEDSLVLTEDDHIDYLIASASERLMPPEVESALVDNSLLFLGFRLTDWSFRVLFRLLMSLPGKDRLKQYCHVAVQVDPDLHTSADLEGAKAYLSKYFGSEANIDLYWGTPREFLAQLREELDRAGTHVDDAPPEEDAWDF